MEGVFYIKLSKPCYQSVFSKNEEVLYNVGAKVSKFTVGEKPREIFAIKGIRHPSEICLSDDEKMIATFTTQGYVFIHNTENADLVAWTKGVKEEGSGIHFLNHKNQVIFSTWNGKIIFFDFLTKNFEMIVLPEVCNLYLAKTGNENNFLLFCEEVENDYGIQKVKFIDVNIKAVQELFRIGNMDIVCNFYNVANNYYFIGTQQFLASLFVYDAEKNMMRELFSIPDEIAQTGDYEKCLCINQKETMALIGYDKLYLVDIYEQRIIKSFEARYLSFAAFFDDDRKILIGTWEKSWTVDL